MNFLTMAPEAKSIPDPGRELLKDFTCLDQSSHLVSHNQTLTVKSGEHIELVLHCQQVSRKVQTSMRLKKEVLEVTLKPDSQTIIHLGLLAQTQYVRMTRLYPVRVWLRQTTSHPPLPSVCHQCCHTG